MNALKQFLVQGICLELFVELDNHVSVLVVMVGLVKFCLRFHPQLYYILPGQRDGQASADGGWWQLLE